MTDPYNRPEILYLDRQDNSGVPGKILICEICGQPLNTFLSAQGETYVHPRPYVAYDHDPAPALIDEDDNRAAPCDFCGDQTRMHWRFYGERTRSQHVIVGDGGQPVVQIQDYGTQWLACEPCSDLLHRSDIEALMERLSAKLGSDDSRTARIMMANTLGMWVKFLNTVYDMRYVGPRREPARLSPRMLPRLQRGLLKFWRNPKTYERFTVNKEEHGFTHSVPGVHAGHEDNFITRFPPGQTMDRTTWDNYTRHLCAGIEGGELFWISGDFTQLAIMAGKDFDKLVISREELPATFGFMVFEDPIGEIIRPGQPAHIRAVSWTLIPQGIWVNIYFQIEDGEGPDFDVVAARADYGYLLSPSTGGGFVFDQEMMIDEEERFGFFATILATWFLMAQPGVAESEIAPVEKKYARSYQREHGRKIPDVLLVDLRRRPHRSGDAIERAGRKLSVRVYRRGHWKRQAYGVKRGLRKTIYVSGYIAGPEGAPLAERPTRVNILR